MDDAEARRHAETLREAASILRRRSRKPRGFWVGVFCKVLTDTADKIDLERWERHG